MLVLLVLPFMPADCAVILPYLSSTSCVLTFLLVEYSLAARSIAWGLSRKLCVSPTPFCVPSPGPRPGSRSRTRPVTSNKCLLRHEPAAVL